MEALALAVAALTGAGMVWSLVLTWHAQRHQALMSRWYHSMWAVTGISPMRFSRTVIPMTLLTVAFCLFGAVTVSMMSFGDRLRWLQLEVQGLIASVLLGLVLLAAVANLVVPRWGRPRFLVLPPCRDLSAAEVEQWLTLRDERDNRREQAPLPTSQGAVAGGTSRRRRRREGGGGPAERVQ